MPARLRLVWLVLTLPVQLGWLALETTILHRVRRRQLRRALRERGLPAEDAAELARAWPPPWWAIARAVWRVANAPPG